MSQTKALAVAEYTIRLQREESYARQAMLRMRLAKPSDRVHGSSNGGPERADAYHWRQCKRHLKKASEARKALEAVL